MAIDPKLVSIKTVGELPVSDPTDSANFLFYEDEELKRSPMNYRETTTWQDGTAMTDEKVDGVIYVKYGAKYYKRIIDAFADPKWFGAKGDGTTDDTVPVLKALSSGVPIKFNSRHKMSYAIRIVNAKIDLDFGADSVLICSAQGLQARYTYDATARTLTEDIQAADNTTIEFVNCSGRVRNINIEDTADSVAGVSVSLLLRQCDSLDVLNATITGTKDIGFCAFESDNSRYKVKILGTDQNRTGNAAHLIGCANTWIENSSAVKCQFGFTVIGPGYGSGTRADLNSSRSYQNTLNSCVKNSLVVDHTQHAFNMNGTVGCGFDGNTAMSYTGTGGNAAIQVKQSTNTGDAGAEFTIANWVVNCTTFDQVTGFGTQEGAFVKFVNNTAIRSKRNAMYINSTHGVSVSDFTVIDWGLDLASWPLLNGETDCGAISFGNGSDRSTVNGLTCAIRDTTNVNIHKLSFVNLGASNITVNNIQFDRANYFPIGVITSGSNQITGLNFPLGVGQKVIISGVPAGTTVTAVSGNTATLSNNATASNTVQITQLLSRAFNVTASGCRFLAGVRLEGSIYANSIVNDNQVGTIYPLEYSKFMDLTVLGTLYFDALPSRGLVPCVISVANVIAPTGAGKYQVGRLGTNSAFVGTRDPIATGSEAIIPNSNSSSSPFQPLSVTVTTAATAGSQIVSIKGFPQL